MDGDEDGEEAKATAVHGEEGPEGTKRKDGGGGGDDQASQGEEQAQGRNQ